MDQGSPQSQCYASYMPLQSTLSHLQNSPQRDSSLRKRLHQLMSENFELKEEIVSIQLQLKTSYQTQQQLKQRLKVALQEVSASDEYIEKCKQLEQELRQSVKKLCQELKQTRQELADQKKAVTSLTQHNNSLQIETRLVAEIKQKYHLEVSRTKLELDQAKIQIQNLQCDKDHLSNELSRMLHQIEDLTAELQARKSEMQQYESYVIEKISEATTSPDRYQKCLAERDRYYCKYLKHKEKSLMYQKERDELLGHLSKLNKEIGSSSMRQYVQ